MSLRFRFTLLLIAAGCASPSTPEEVTDVHTPGLMPYNPDYRYDPLTIEIDGETEDRGAGSLGSAAIEPGLDGACAASTQVHYMTDPHWVNEHGKGMQGTFYFPGALTDGAVAELQGAPFEDGFTGIHATNWQGYDVTKINGGTVTYDASQPGVHVFTIEGTRICEHQDREPWIVESTCGPVTDIVLTFAGNLGVGDAVPGVAGYTTSAGELCVEDVPVDTSDLD